MRITRYRGSIVLAGLTLAALALGGCSGAPARPEVSQQPLNTAAPGTLATAPPPDTGGGGGGGVALNLASLPIGGGFEDDSSPTCVVVNWIPKHPDDQLPEGVKVTVTDARFDPEAFLPVDAGCSDNQPSCFGFSFGAGQKACGLGVKPTGVAGSAEDGQASLTVAGTVVCADPASEECASFFRTVRDDNGSAIQVDVPPLPSQPPTGTATP